MTRPPQTIDLAKLIDNRRLTRFNYLVIALSWLITLFDGLDIMMVSYTAPYMRDELGLSKAMLGSLFSAGTVGTIIGGLVFTYVADRIGRRPTIIMTSFAFGILTMAIAAAQNFEQLLILRFLDGLAIGGMLPLAWALNIEFVPIRSRATVVAVIMMGYSLGSAVSAPMTNFIAPVYGWQGVYIAGGLGTLVCATALALWLPESVRFLASKKIRPELVAMTLNRMDPGSGVLTHDEFILSDEKPRTRNFHMSDLFEGRLRYITPLVWLGYLISSLAIFFTSQWGPSVLEELEVPRQMAALVSSLGGLLGAFTGMAVTRLSERKGVAMLAVVPAMAVPVLVALGLGLLPQGLFLPAIVLQSMLIGGGHSAIIALCGIYYPSAIRASGSGWASAIGKVGGTMGPLIGAAVLTSGLPVLRSYALVAICPAILFASMIGIAAVLRRWSGRSEDSGSQPQES